MTKINKNELVIGRRLSNLKITRRDLMQERLAGDNGA